jgi:hypothetical protein
MFLHDQTDYIHARFYSTYYFGRLLVLNEIVSLFEKHSDFRPDRWGTDERTRSTYNNNDFDRLQEEWTRKQPMTEMCFSRKNPEMLICFSIERYSKAKFNDVSLLIRESAIRSKEQVARLLDFSIELCCIIRSDYGFIAHTLQERRQSPIQTPAERLPGVYWANFFGRPYIEFFGKKKLLATTAHQVRSINEELILILMGDRPDTPTMINDDDVVNPVKQYLNQNAFAGPKFPDEPCSVPAFSFGDLRRSSDYGPEETREEMALRLRHDLESCGYTLINESNSQWTFLSRDGSTIQVDRDRAELVFDVTGKSLNDTPPK